MTKTMCFKFTFLYNNFLLFSLFFNNLLILQPESDEFKAIALLNTRLSKEMNDVKKNVQHLGAEVKRSNLLTDYDFVSNLCALSAHFFPFLILAANVENV